MELYPSYRLTGITLLTIGLILIIIMAFIFFGYQLVQGKNTLFAGVIPVLAVLTAGPGYVFLQAHQIKKARKYLEISRRAVWSAISLIIASNLVLLLSAFLPQFNGADIGPGFFTQSLGYLGLTLSMVPYAWAVIFSLVAAVTIFKK